MSNIGKLNIIIPSVEEGYKDNLTELNGYKESCFQFNIRLLKSSSNSKSRSKDLYYNQLILSRDISYDHNVFHSDIFHHISDVHTLTNTYTNGCVLRYINTINIPLIFDVILNKDINLSTHLSILPKSPTCTPYFLDSHMTNKHLLKN